MAGLRARFTGFEAAMNPLTLSLSDNTPGADPYAVLFNTIAQQYPNLGYTQENANIGAIARWPARYKPNRTYLKVVAKDDPRHFTEFFYNRFDITLLVSNPLFTDAEGQALADSTGIEVLAAIAGKINQNLTEADFWVDPYQFTHTGGTNTPNFRLKSRFSSPFWMGDMVVWLHSKTPAPTAT